MSIFKPALTVSHQLLNISVLFPFLGPALQKMNVSFFPADVLDFFFNFLKKIKSTRSKNEHKVIKWINYYK